MVSHFRPGIVRVDDALSRVLRLLRKPNQIRGILWRLPETHLAHLVRSGPTLRQSLSAVETGGVIELTVDVQRLAPSCSGGNRAKAIGRLQAVGCRPRMSPHISSTSSDAVSGVQAFRST